MYICVDALRRKGLPYRVRECSAQFKPQEDSMHESKARDVEKDGALVAWLVYVATNIYESRF